MENSKIINKNKDIISYEYFDVTADVGFLAYGSKLEEAYENAGLAMFNVITNTDLVEKKESMEIAIESEDLVSLLYDYLEELLFLQETQFIFFSEFKLAIAFDENKENSYSLKGQIYGESIDWNKHSHGSEVKAITFHKMAVDELDNGTFKIRAILDL